LTNLVFCQFLKKICQVKKSSSPTIWHNSLAKPRSNLHQESWEKQNYVYVLPPLKNLHWESFSVLYFFFHPPTYFISFFTLPPTWKRRWQPRFARTYAKFLFLPNWSAKLLEVNFSYFAKIR
jgi:hypothetical protein